MQDNFNSNTEADYPSSNIFPVSLRELQTNSSVKTVPTQDYTRLHVNILIYRRNTMLICTLILNIEQSRSKPLTRHRLLILPFLCLMNP